MQAWLLGLAVTCVAVLASSLWIDRPVAYLFHSLVGRPYILITLRHTPALFVPLAALAVAILIARRLASRSVGRSDVVLLLVSLSAVIGLALKAPLKFMFGRAWPQTLIRDDIYGFYPFQTNAAFGAFPSGHMAAVSAALSVLWVYYPRFRYIYLVAAMLFAGGLVAANYHFVGDVIAGAFLGVTSAILASHFWELWRRRRRSSARARQ
jgi:membrane-associated phospholipid phosphatase